MFVTRIVNTVRAWSFLWSRRTKLKRGSSNLPWKDLTDRERCVLMSLLEDRGKETPFTSDLSRRLLRNTKGGLENRNTVPVLHCRISRTVMLQ